MNNTQQQFLSLLCSGLWNKPIINTDPVLEYADWDAIIEIARKQTVLGVLFDGITKLSPERQPPAPLLRKLYQSVIRIEQSNLLMNKCLAEVVSAMNKENIHSVLLKGQGVAQNYLNPLRRQCGDIDLYVGKENGSKAMYLLINLGAQPENKTKIKNAKHESFLLNEIIIELHYLAEKLWNPFNNLKFQIWTKQHLHGDKLRVFNISGTNVFIPPVNFDATYIFQHIFHHFITLGIGLRQICDWTLYLYSFKDRIDKSVLLRDLKDFGLLKAWQIFGYIAVNNLGLSKDIFPFYTEKYKMHSIKVLNWVLQIGNFGHHNPNISKRPIGYLSGKLHSFYYKQLWLIKIFMILPKAIFTYYIFFFTKGIYYLLRGK